MITSTIVKVKYLHPMLADGWKLYRHDVHSCVLFKVGEHQLVNGLSEAVHKKLEREMVKRNRFQVIK